MTPDAIRTVAQIRQEFHTSFAAAIGLPVSITKGNSHSSNPAKLSWSDQHQRVNYICVYAHLAPDELLPHRPLILRLGINKGLGFELSRKAQTSQPTEQKLLRFELTLLPDELISFVPWLVTLLEARYADSAVVSAAPCRLRCSSLNQLLGQGAWTSKAAICASQAAQADIDEDEAIGSTASFAMGA